MSAQRLKLVTARYLSEMSRPHRTKTLQLLRSWQTFCDQSGIHVLDCSAANCQAYVDWLSMKYTPTSARNRLLTVRRWFDALAKAGVIKGHGFHAVKMASKSPRVVATVVVSDDEIAALIAEAAKRGPRVEWFVSMLCHAGVDVAETLRVRSTDVRTWQGRTLVKIHTNTRLPREVPVDGRLEVLTLGLAAVFAPTTAFAGMSRRRASEILREITEAAVGRELHAPDLRRSAIRRQYDRGVSVAVIAKWLGFTSETQARKVLGLADPVAAVAHADMVDAIKLEADAERFGSGSPADVLLDAMPDEGPE